MTPRQIGLIRTSFARTGSCREELGESVYQHVFAAASDARALFRKDICENAVNLMGAVGMVVQALDQLDAVAPTLRALRRRRARDGVTAQHLALGGTALLLALADHAGTLALEVEAAWSCALLADVMLEDAAAAVPVAPGPSALPRLSVR